MGELRYRQTRQNPGCDRRFHSVRNSTKAVGFLNLASPFPAKDDRAFQQEDAL
jgi:hypothetical protein